MPFRCREKGTVARPTTEPCDLLNWRSAYADPADRPKRRSANVEGRRESKIARLEEQKQLVASTVSQMIAGVRSFMPLLEIIVIHMS